jgi:hypothetical protein
MGRKIMAVATENMLSVPILPHTELNRFLAHIADRQVEVCAITATLAPLRISLVYKSDAFYGLRVRNWRKWLRHGKWSVKGKRDVHQG